MLIKTEIDRIKTIEQIKNLDLREQWFVKIKKQRSRRSLDQNALLWLWMTALEVDSETGYTKEEWKEFFQTKFCPRTKMKINREDYEIVKSTSQLDTKEFTDFLERIQHFVYHELYFSLPQPSDYWFEQFKEYYEDNL